MDDVSPKGLPPRHAWQLVQENPRALLIDIRSNMEHLFIGHPVGAVHIAWLDEPDWVPNPRFVPQIRELMLGGAVCENGDCPAIILICRSGRRSREAGEMLLESGFRRVYNVEGGFEGPLDAEHHRGTVAGWRFEGLPWEQC